MSEFIDKIFKRGFKQTIPEGHSEYSGPCLRVALFQAGFDTDIPSWVDTSEVPKICQELGLSLHMGLGTLELHSDQPCIVGTITKRDGENKIGHWVYINNPKEELKKTEPQDIFAIIEIPKR